MQKGTSIPDHKYRVQIQTIENLKENNMAIRFYKQQVNKLLSTELLDFLMRNTKQNQESRFLTLLICKIYSTKGIFSNYSKNRNLCKFFFFDENTKFFFERTNCLNFEINN